LVKKYLVEGIFYSIIIQANVIFIGWRVDQLFFYQKHSRQKGRSLAGSLKCKKSVFNKIIKWSIFFRFASKKDDTTNMGVEELLSINPLQRGFSNQAAATTADAAAAVKNTNFRSQKTAKTKPAVIFSFPKFQPTDELPAVGTSPLSNTYNISHRVLADKKKSHSNKSDFKKKNVTMMAFPKIQNASEMYLPVKPVTSPSPPVMQPPVTSPSPPVPVLPVTSPSPPSMKLPGTSPSPPVPRLPDTSTQASSFDPLSSGLISPVSLTMPESTTRFAKHIIFLIY